jgi:AAA+ superfamily predicted ATPase
MFARVLAQFSGMDYAIMSGASFSQFTNGEGITEMNKLIQWGRQNANGLMIIIDEAEAFLGARMQNSKDYKVTKESYQLLTNFLHLTGERSDKIMFVFCTNRQEALDPAMKRRIDDAVQLHLPGHEERVGIIQLYRNEILLDPADNTEQFMQAVKTYLTDEVIHDIAKKTNGLSGGELEGIINMLVSDAAITEDGLVSAQLVDKVVQQMIDKHASFAKVFHTGAAAA